MTDLKIAYLMPSVSRTAGGIFEVERRLAQCLSQSPGVKLEAFGTEDQFTALDAPAWDPVNVHAFPSYGPNSFGWSPALSRAFESVTADVGHLHVLWMHTSLIMRRWSRRQRKPFVTTLHGMLDSWALTNSRKKKQLCALLYERSCLDSAACIQAFSEAELFSTRAYGLKNPVCIIPNGIDIPPESTVSPPWTNQIPNDKKVLLYLGRLHPKKGLVNLLGAWKQLRSTSPASVEPWRLAIAGWSQGGHDDELKSLTSDFGLNGDVVFLGPLHGHAKAAAYSNSSAVVLPSFSEGLPMAVLEAWSYKKPVLMTPQCNLPEGFAANAALEAQPNVDSLAKGVALLAEATDAERQEMGGNGWRLVNQKFTWSHVTSEMLFVYRWLVGGGDAPSCVVRT